MSDYQVKVNFLFGSKDNVDSGENSCYYTWTGTYQEMVAFERDVIIPVANELNTRANNFGQTLIEHAGKGK